MIKKAAIGCSVPLLLVCLGVVIIVAVFFSGAGGIFGWLFGGGAPGNEPPTNQPAAAPIYGTPTLVILPTLEPTRTPMPPPPTPLQLESCAAGPPDPSATPDAEATAQAVQACEEAQQRQRGTATALYRGWAATATAYPTATPLPPTPVGGGPYGWPIDPYCRGRAGCASRDGIRVTTQDYGCTGFLESLSQFCQNTNNQGDHRYSANGCGGCSQWHNGVDLDVGENEELWPVLDGVVVFAGDNPAGVQYGCGRYMIIQDVSGKFMTYYCHMASIGVAVDIETGVTLGRNWQAGDRIKTFTSNGAHIFLGIAGSTGYSTGPHLHFMLKRRGTLGWTDVDPVAYMNRQPGSPLPIPDPPYGG